MNAERGDASAAIRDENERARKAQLLADLTCALLSQTRNLSLEEGLAIIARAREGVLRLFPDREPVFNLLYRPRFLRILAERLQKEKTDINP